MTLRSRITLILSGIAVFFILAPMLVFLARGFRYDFENNRVLKTGTLVVKTDPRGAEVFLGDKKLDDSPLTKRFVVPGEYDLEIKKPLYLTWGKKITIHPEQVTTLKSAESEKIFLLFAYPSETLISTTTSDLIQSQNAVYFVAQNKVLSLDANSLAQDVVSTSTPDFLSSLRGSEEYFIQAENGKARLWKKSNPPQLIFDNLPSFQNQKIIATPSRQIFLLLDDDLYQLTQTLEKINSRVTEVLWNEEASVLLYGNSNEIWLYNPIEGTPNQLVTRSSKTLGLPVYNKKTGYVFVGEEKEIKAIELTTGQPNIYTLARLSHPKPKLLVNAEGTILIYLDGPNLRGLNIR